MSHKPSYLAKNKDDLWKLARAKAVNGVANRVFFQLTPSEQRRPTSGWGVKHLIAFDLITESLGKDSLEVLDHEADHENTCPRCDQNDKTASTLQELDVDYANELLGNGPENYQEKADSELLRGWPRTGPFWVALGRAGRTEYGHPPELRSQRLRRQYVRPGFVDPTTAIPSSSSPSATNRLSQQEQRLPSSPSQPRNASRSGSSAIDISISSSPPRPAGSSSAFAPSEGDVNEDDLLDRSILPEQTTVHLCLTFLQYTLSCCIKHDLTALVESGGSLIEKLDVQARWERKRARVRIGKNTVVIGEDDGGVCMVALTQRQWTTFDPYMARLEGKKAPSRRDWDDRINEVSYSVSEEVLAQYLGEAVTAWDESQGRDNHVIIIAPINAFVQFIDFRFGDDYAPYLKAGDTEKQLELVNDNNKDICVYVNTTRPFNLQKMRDRGAAFCQVASIARRWQSRLLREISERMDISTDEGEPYESDDSIQW